MSVSWCRNDSRCVSLWNACLKVSDISWDCVDVSKSKIRVRYLKFKMPVVNLLELDIKTVFEGHTIKEVEQIQKKIQNESERKKVELRTLVGERYRDLIEAADTIAEMKQTSECVIARICNMEETCHKLQQKYLIGFKMDPPEQMLESNKSNEAYDSIVMQIKILMDIPEQIWSAVDTENFLLATQLFLFAQHINYSLRIEVGNSDLATKYPIILKQWGVISHFRNVILTGCNKVLQSLELPVESAANCLASLVLLDGMASTELLKKLITLRSQAVEAVIKDESHLSVRNRISLSVKMLTHVIDLLYSCFVETNGKEQGLVLQCVEEVAGSNAPTTLSLLKVDRDLTDKFLSPFAKSHKPSTRGEIEPIPEAELKNNLTNWLSWVEGFVKREVSKLLDLVTSVKGIHNIREEVLALEVPQNWEIMCKKLSLEKTVNFWGDYFQLLLTERVKGIVSIKWDETLFNLKTDLFDTLNKVAHDKCEYPEHDLRWYIWKDSPSDIPQKLNRNGADNERLLLMKTRGFSPNLAKLCESFDRNLLNLLQDLHLYLYQSQKSTTTTTDLLAVKISSTLNKFVDREIVQEQLQVISTQKVHELSQFIRDECLVEDAKVGKREVNAILTARFFQALTILCPSLNKCFTLSKVSGIVIPNTKWQSICDTLRDDSLAAWTVWAKIFKRKIHDHKEGIMPRSLNVLKMQTMICDWEKVTIEEEAEEGKRMKSEILVPYQPSISVQKFLAVVSKDLNSIIPHTLPKKILHEIVDTVVTELFEYYAELSKNDDLKQKQALQTLLDTKYVTLLMIPRENKKFVDKSSQICDDIQSKIDPFDLDVFYPFIHANVKKSAQRTQLIFGNLVPHSEQLLSVLGARMNPVAGDGAKGATEAPGVLAVCSGAPWFPPLTVTAPARTVPIVSIASLQDKSMRKKTPTKTHARTDSAGASIKSGAAAFFGAMGSDWFGTG
ncbi:conserved oligomeric Golgi complex subunit 1 isoform X1 [Neodiprion fabricii]|uniref:conserved oligomeric Golgi complex subunit 1 isoform X1 n=2 Tax=Neodiprion fabricii TaxID=2872261 RepID=UPI001ED8DDD6|nr:conserved oligomeric Golgi complex subunit 1 isoform X1 [Neodiprion fabricii]